MRPTDDGGPGRGSVSITDPCQLMPDVCYTPDPAPVVEPSAPSQQLPNIPGGDSPTLMQRRAVRQHQRQRLNTAHDEP
jgi:hypothetical protein